jgi:hypothetical protein
MDQSKLKLLTELSPDTTECGNKEKKPQLTLSPVSSLGQEDFCIEPNSTKTKNSNASAILFKPVLSNVSKKDL